MEVEFSILSLGAFSRDARGGVVERMNFNPVITSCKSRDANLRVPSVLMKECFSFGVLRFHNRMDVNPVLAFVERRPTPYRHKLVQSQVAIVRVCAVD